MMPTSRVLVVVPIFNVSKQILRVIEKLEKQIGDLIDGLLVIDNQSTDESVQVALVGIQNSSIKNRWLIQNRSNRGLGGSLKVGFKFAIFNRYTHVLVVHGDDQANPEDFRKVLTSSELMKLSKVFGARFTTGSKLNGYSQLRTFGNRLLNLICSLMMRRKISDLGSGLNLYSCEFLAESFIYSCRDDLTFNNEFLLSEPQPVKPEAYVPISWIEDDQISNAKVMRQGIRTLWLAFGYGILGWQTQVVESREAEYGPNTFEILLANVKKDTR